nr:MAG TPA: hypothetical protein [Caudoviricetes sp.]
MNLKTALPCSFIGVAPIHNKSCSAGRHFPQE